jgi:succinoglycan biosynthesis transport protein ExoP
MSMDTKGELTPDDANWQERHPTHQSPPKALKLAGVDSSADEGGLDLDRIWKTIQRRLWILLVANALMVGATIVWSRTRPPAYEGSFNMLIEPVTAEAQVVASLNGNNTSVGEQDLGSAQVSNTTLDYPTQIRLLLSDKLLLPVSKKLKTDYPHLSYETLKNSLSINRLKESSETKILEVRYRSSSASETKQVMNLVSKAYIQYSISERQSNVRRAIQFVDAQLPKSQAEVRNLESALQTFREQNQLIDPSNLGTQLGAQKSNTQQEQIATQVELAKTKQLYRSLERQLQLQPKGAEAASVLSEAPEYQLLVKKLQELDIDIQTQSAELTEEHPKMIALREKRQGLLPLLAQKANSTLGSSLSKSIPNVQSLPFQNALRQDLSKQLIAAANQVQVLEAKLNGLNVASQTLATQTGQLPIVTRQYENIQRQLKISTEKLSKFLQKREELMINAARQEVPWELTASPAVKETSSSSLGKDVLLGSIAGLLLGIGAALSLEKMNDIIYSLKDLRAEISLPILGMIPPREDEQQSGSNSTFTETKNVVSLLKEKDTIDTNSRYRFSAFIESFRALNSQVRLLNPDEPIQSLVVSSSLPNEGKTTIAIQLAQAAAAMGQRVLLVNADLRKPSLQNLVAPDPNQTVIHGLTDVIAGNVQLKDAVQLLPGEKNLYVLLAGSVALDPTSILSSKKMQNLMKICQHHFDLVIYDTVPLSFADSLLLIPHTDGLLMVSRLGKVHREDLRNSLRTLEVSKVAVLGLVVNMVNTPQSLSGAYYTQQATKR